MCFPGENSDRPNSAAVLTETVTAIALESIAISQPYQTGDLSVTYGYSLPGYRNGFNATFPNPMRGTSGRWR